MKHQAIRKPKFLQNIEMVSHVMPVEFSAPRGLQKPQANDIFIEEEKLTETHSKKEASTPSFIASTVEDSEQEQQTAGMDSSTALRTEGPEDLTAEASEASEASAQEQPTTTPQLNEGDDEQQEDPVQLEAAKQPELGIDAKIATEKMIRLIEHLKQANHRLAEEARSTALEIGFQVAQRILEKEVTGDVSAMMSLVRSALRQSSDAKILRISLHPKDHANITKSLEEGQFREISLTQIELVPDASLERGDVLVDTNFGQIDGRIETRLKEIKTVIDDSNEGEPYGTL
jgi:flagellar assembly protein FliH